jgi:hypothetical protein
LKKHNNSAKKNEQPSKRAKSQGPVQRDTKEVLAELVGKLKEKLDPKVVAASAGEEHRRGGLRPNLDRLTWARSAIYRDSSDNIIRLLSIRGDYCVYAYVTIGIPRSEMHRSVTGLTRRDVFEAGFIFVAECVEDWNRIRRKFRQAGSGITYPSSLGSIDVSSVGANELDD